MLLVTVQISTFSIVVPKKSAAFSEQEYDGDVTLCEHALISFLFAPFYTASKLDSIYQASIHFWPDFQLHTKEVMTTEASSRK